MFRIIHPNRWFIWTIALTVMIFIIVWGAIERYAIEQEYSYTGDEFYYSVRLHKKSPDISSWKTYRNEKYGFQMEVPIGSSNAWYFEIMPQDGSNQEQLWLTTDSLLRIIIDPESSWSPDLTRADRVSNIVRSGKQAKRYEFFSDDGNYTYVIENIENTKFQIDFLAINARESFNKEELGWMENMLSTLTFFEPKRGL